MTQKTTRQPGRTPNPPPPPPPPARPFLVRLTDGQTWAGAEFAGGFVCVHHPDECNVCTIAVSPDALLADRPDSHPLHGAVIENIE